MGKNYTGKISVHKKMFVPYEHNISATFLLNRKKSQLETLPGRRDNSFPNEQNKNYLAGLNIFLLPEITFSYMNILLGADYMEHFEPFMTDKLSPVDQAENSALPLL